MTILKFRNSNVEKQLECSHMLFSLNEALQIIILGSEFCTKFAWVLKYGVFGDFFRNTNAHMTSKLHSLCKAV